MKAEENLLFRISNYLCGTSTPEEVEQSSLLLEHAGLLTGPSCPQVQHMDGGKGNLPRGDPDRHCLGHVITFNINNKKCPDNMHPTWDFWELPLLDP